ncbi:hypothetical protein [Nesterenkonia pannonica]|uniref:hypothetical protein n=1 Tax=Nesterenkonia pannonica TaxID=1548602 RepID=UPI002164D8C3|nr:hypothetical protein [Nesterenkonia pannonica]
MGAPLLAVAAIALVAAPARRVLLFTGLSALAALLLSAATSRLTAGAAGSELVAAHTGPLVSATLLCLTLCALMALRTATAAGASGSFLPVASTLLVLGVFAAAVLWAAPRLLLTAELSDRTITAVHHQPVLVERGSLRDIPASAADQGTGPQQLRTLILGSSDGMVEAELTAGQGRTLDAHRTPVSVDGLPLFVASDSAEAELDAPDERTAELVGALLTPEARGSDL